MLSEGTVIRASKNLNNLIVQDYCNVKSRTNVMLDFKLFGNVASPISGMELLHSHPGVSAHGRIAVESAASLVLQSQGHGGRRRRLSPV